MKSMIFKYLSGSCISLYTFKNLFFVFTINQNNSGLASDLERKHDFTEPLSTQAFAEY